MANPEQASVLDRSQQSKRRMGILCVNMDPASKAMLETLVVETPGAYVVDNVDAGVNPREVMRFLEPYQHKICVVDLTAPQEGTRACARLRDGCEGVAIFAASEDLEPEQLLTAMRAGCSEYLAKPFQANAVSAALAHMEERRRIRSEGVSRGQLVTLMGAKGGTGVTSLAIHLALNLVQKHQKKCVIVDQHPSLGDVSLYLGLPRHRYSFYELVHNTDRLDRDLLEGFLLRHESGLEVLDSPEAIDAFPHTHPEAIEHTLAFLADSYDFVIVDCPPGLSEDTCAAIRQSDHLAIIIIPELAAVRNAARAIEYLTGLHYPEDSIDVVLNRRSDRDPLKVQEIETTIHRPLGVRIPNDYTQVVNAISSGTPILFNRHSDLPVAFNGWGSRLAGQENGEPPPKKRRLFALFGGSAER